MPRKSLKHYRSLTTYQLSAASSDASGYLRRVSAGNVDRPSAARIDVCKFIINHTIGTPRQKIEHIDAENTKTLEQFTTNELRELLTLADSRAVDNENERGIGAHRVFKGRAREDVAGASSRGVEIDSDNVAGIAAALSAGNEDRGSIAGDAANYLDNVAANLAADIVENERD